jgi:hypothetical protein
VCCQTRAAVFFHPCLMVPGKLAFCAKMGVLELQQFLLACTRFRMIVTVGAATRKQHVAVALNDVVVLILKTLCCSGPAGTLSGGQTSSAAAAVRSSSGGGPSAGSSAAGGARSAAPAATLGNWPSMVQSSSTHSGTDVQADIYEYSSTQGDNTSTPVVHPPLHAGLPRGAFAGSDSDSRSPGLPGHGAHATPGQLVDSSGSSVGGLVRSTAAWCALTPCHYSCALYQAQRTAELGCSCRGTRLLCDGPDPKHRFLTIQ